MSADNEGLLNSGELYEHYNFTADKGQDLMRIDKFLMDRIPNTSRSKLQNAALKENILVNDHAVKPSYKIKPRDHIRIVMPYPVQEFELLPEKLPLDIIEEDDDVIVLNKPAGLVVHPGHGNHTGTLVNGLLHHFTELPLSKDEHARPGLVHRLDKNTTGIMVVAKTEHALSDLSQQFFNRTTERTYHALVWGNVTDDEGTIEGYLGRSLKDRKIMQVFTEPQKGKEAITDYKVIERLGYMTYLSCKLRTGRTHQIRAHFKHIGHPLMGDRQYGGDKIVEGGQFSKKYKQFVNNCFKMMPRQALHAKSLAFKHPTSFEWKHFESEMPEDMHSVLGKWRNYVQQF